PSATKIYTLSLHDALPIFGRADEKYSTFLHEKGFTFNGRRFKMFTFSQLDCLPYKLLGNKIQLLGNEISLNVRFLVDSSMEHFIDQKSTRLNSSHVKISYA